MIEMAWLHCGASYLRPGLVCTAVTQSTTRLHGQDRAASSAYSDVGPLGRRTPNSTSSLGLLFGRLLFFCL
jgi:hypothetical protein